MLNYQLHLYIILSFHLRFIFSAIVYFVKVSIPGCKWRDELYIKLE